MKEKILVVRYGTIGDTIFASAFYRELKNAKPNAIIDALVDNIAASILINCPYIDNIRYLKGEYKDIFYYINLFKNYDKIYFLKNSNFLTFFALLANVKNRIGFDVRRNVGLTTKVKYDNKKHEIDYYLDLLRATNIPVASTDTELWLPDSKSEKIANIVNSISGKKVLIHAGSRFKGKNWNNAKWNEVLYKLMNTYDCNIIFVGGNSDRKTYNEILSGENKIDSKKIINLCGKLKIEETIELVKDVDLVIGIDSGVIHIAAVFNIPSILLSGPTSLIRWTPRSEACQVINKTEKYCCAPCIFEGKKQYCKNLKTAKCMEEIKTTDVLDKVKNVFHN